MIYVSFTLTMPNVASWNGKWSGEGMGYFITRSFPDKSEQANKIKELLAGRSHQDFYYRWDDGWGANVCMEISNAASCRKLRKKSAGFCGYDWMVDSIIKNGEILTR